MAKAATRVILPPASMFARTPVYDVNGQVVFGLMQPIVQPRDGDKLATVTQPVENRLDLMSSRLVGDERYWWAIAQVNSMIDPLTDAYLGAVLRIPDRRTLD